MRCRLKNRATHTAKSMLNYFSFERFQIFFRIFLGPPKKTSFLNECRHAPGFSKFSILWKKMSVSCRYMSYIEKVKNPEHADECRKTPILGEKPGGADFRISETFYKIEKEVIIEALLSIL